MIKQAVYSLLPFLPVNILEKLADSNPSSLKYRLATAGLHQRDVTVRHGIAKGLKFNIGESCPELGLGTYELPIQEIFQQNLHAGDVFYDIGANVGFFSIIAAKLVGNSGQVYSFEPGETNAKSVRHNAQLNNFTHIEVIEKAVSETSGEGELILAKYSGGHALATADAPPDVAGRVTIDLVSIDDLIAENSIKPPNFVKIDIEGAELSALKGMKETIRKYQPTIIYEVDDGDSLAYQRKYQELEAFFKTLDYQVKPVNQDSYATIDWCVGHAIATPAR
ncbi:methyltransferase FkbM family protein [Chondrocystis sp. NIES-4102]|nr:methyltransferase FkbM family protein [Chondrocystis sp. NIES-4102]